jgi:hypothetical protein
MSVLLFLGDMSGSEVILTLPFLLASAALYFLPTYIAWGKQNQWPIFWVNLLAGGTGLGWLGALIWAINTPRYAPPALEPTPADELNKLAGLRQAGYLTEDEFIQAKARVL